MLRGRLSAALAVCAVLAGSSRPQPAGGQEAEGIEEAVLSAAEVTIRVRPDTGWVSSIRVGQAKEEMARPHPAGSERPFAFVEVVDLRDGRIYHPSWAASTITDWKVQAGGALSFIQQYRGAPFRAAHRLWATPPGLRWEVALRLLEDQQQNRSVEVAWMLPIPFGWRFWGPNDTSSHLTDEVTPYRYVYAHTDHNEYGIIIPLVGAWGQRGGLAVFSPPDVRKCQIIFDVFTQRKSDPARGVHRRLEDLQMLRISHHMVGLRPGKDLKLAICLAGCRPDWRAVMGHYVNSFPELFEPVPAARKYEGMYGISNASQLQRGALAGSKSAGVTCLEVHGHFPEYGIYITPEAIKDPKLTWRCLPHPAAELSLETNRRLIDEALKQGIGPFMYFYNVHADPETISRRFAADLLVRETGRPAIQYQGQPALRAQGDSPFGKHLIEQLELMLKAYPKAPGLFVDNFAQEWLGFNHDDGASMVHNRPCYDMNRNHQEVGTVCFEKAHQAGKVIMVNKLATIESARGADMVLVEGMSPHGLRMHAFACVYRAVFPLAWLGPRGRYSLERCLQYLLLYGGTPAASLSRREQDTLRAYRQLTDAMIGKRWVFDPDPLSLPAGYDGQIFRIDKHAPHGGDVVVSLVDLKRSWREEGSTEGLSVTVRLPEAAQLTKATWIGPSAEPAEPVSCQVQHGDGAVTVALPPLGAAGVLRLSR